MYIFKKSLPLLIIYSAVVLLYFPSLTTYFSHDDFFHFKISMTDGSLGQFVNFFGFHPFNERLIAFYRPIFREVLYNTFYNLFGLNQLPFRLLSFAIHFINIYLVFNLMQLLFKKKFISYFASFFFAITAANVSSFYYLAGGIQTQGATMLILLSIITFILYLDEKAIKLKYFSFVFFILALSSHEQSAIIPLLMVGILFIKFKYKTAIKKIFTLWSFFLFVAIYIYLNITVIGYSSTETQYQMVFGLKTNLQTILWYLVWALGLPETFVDFLLPSFKLNPSLMRYWGNYYRTVFPAFTVSVILILTAKIIIYFKKKNLLFDKKFLFLITWFPLGILPVLFLPAHKSTHYLYPSLPAFWGIIAYLIFNGYNLLIKHHLKLSNIFLFALLTSLTLLSSTSAVLGRTTYWAAQRGILAGILIDEVKTKYPTLPKGAVLYFTNDPEYPFVSEAWGGTSKQAYFALNGEDGLQLLYNDPALRVFYEDLGGVPENFPEEKIYILVARI